VPVLPLHERVPLDGVTVPEPVPDFVTVRVYVTGAAAVNTAVTALADDIVTVHWLPSVESHPDQDVNVEPEFAAAVSTTDVPDVYDAVPVLPFHERVPLDGVTVPEPVPDFVTVRVYVTGATAVNTAVTPLADDIATVHWLPSVELHPDQDVNVEPLSDDDVDAVSTTEVPDVYDAVPVLPLQVRVPLDGVTVPEPVPDFVTVRVYVTGAAAVNTAVTALADDIATVHWLPSVESHPDQDVNVEPLSDDDVDAVSTTEVPDVYDAVPVLPLQVRVPLDGVTVPEPVPDLVTVRV
jgi:stage V sporulation protein SpoVS